MHLFLTDSFAAHYEFATSLRRGMIKTDQIWYYIGLQLIVWIFVFVGFPENSVFFQPMYKVEYQHIDY